VKASFSPAGAAAPALHDPGRLCMAAAVVVKGCELAVPLETFDPAIVSFPYQDTFPAMRCQDDKPYRQQVYTLEELPGLVMLYGLPQEWNVDGKAGSGRYIEAQVWDDAPLKVWLKDKSEAKNP